MQINRLLTTLVLLSILLAACQDGSRPTVQTAGNPAETATRPPQSPAVNPTVETLPTGNDPVTQPAEPTATLAVPEPTATIEPNTPIPPPVRPTALPDIILTPGTPAPATSYRLKAWTAEEADNLGRLMEAYFLHMNRQFALIHDESLTRSFANYPAYAYQEAQQRYPDSPLAATWQSAQEAHLAISAESTLTDPQSDRILAIAQMLWDGTEPAIVVEQLLALSAESTFTPTAQYDYHLGLAYELSGEEQSAAAAYLAAWRDYCCDIWDTPTFFVASQFTTTNPYAIMAQARLIPE